jgi:uncharacterized membrane protein YfcA
MNWSLASVIVLGTLPGVIAGGLIRVKYLPDSRNFKLFMGVVLLYIGIRFLYEIKKRASRAPKMLSPKPVTV